jgi:XTP/dITP diphosphohydrolase
MKIIIATHNDHKVKELNSIVGDSAFKFTSLKEIGWTKEIEEYGTTIAENAWIKAETVFKSLHSPVMGEDTGLFIDTLQGEPGVHSARYAGPERDPQKNIDKVLRAMSANDHRTARFKTVIALIIDDNRHEFTGVCEGRIAHVRLGNKGFGYDPIFIPKGYDYSFGELADKVKDEISHRSLAVGAMLRFLKNQFG